MARGNRETVCQKCGFPIPAISFKGNPPAAKPQPTPVATPSGLAEFTDQPSPFSSATREGKSPAAQTTTFVPFSPSGGPQPARPQARPFVPQSPAPQAQPRPAQAPAPQAARPDAQPPAQSRPKSLSSISALAAKGGDAPAAPVRDAARDGRPRSSSPAPVLSVEGGRPS
ncbi:MAG: hypothetical protein JW839_07860, partial [Candidatus Lokiarchaeota archaeon]|nr:hypothetical protein [Candidatus Lokiarchaeota archaeon]